jgi:hypothetical protein
MASVKTLLVSQVPLSGILLSLLSSLESLFEPLVECVLVGDGGSGYGRLVETSVAGAWYVITLLVSHVPASEMLCEMLCRLFISADFLFDSFDSLIESLFESLLLLSFFFSLFSFFSLLTEGLLDHKPLRAAGRFS